MTSQVTDSDSVLGGRAMRASHGGWRLRLTLVVAGAAVFGGVVTWRSSTESFEERLVNVVAQRILPEAAYDALRGSPKVAAMVVDAANAPEVRFKMQLALIKYGDHAQRVLEAYGDDPRLHVSLARFGEQVVPTIAFYMENDLLVPKVQDAVAGLTEATRKTYRRALGRADREEAAPEMSNTAFNRGLLAMERASKEGHRFLAQFDVQPDGTAHWNTTDRMLASGEQFLLGGLRDLEAKHNTGERIGVADIAWAGADVAIMFGLPNRSSWPPRRGRPAMRCRAPGHWRVPPPGHRARARSNAPRGER